MEITLKQLREWDACRDQYALLAESLGPDYSDDTPITIAQIVESNRWNDAWWVLGYFSNKAVPNMVIEAVEQGAVPDTECVRQAIRNDHPGLVRWLVEHGAAPDTYCVWWAIRNDHPDLARWLVEKIN